MVTSVTILMRDTEPVTLPFDALFVVSLNKLLDKQSSWRVFEKPWRSYDTTVLVYMQLIIEAE